MRISAKLSYFLFFFKQKTAYEMRISDWSSDVCSSDLIKAPAPGELDAVAVINRAFGTMLRKVDGAPQVVIAICEGAVLGGGFGLACVSDIAFAHVDARFGMPETTRGLPPAQIAP